MFNGFSFEKRADGVKNDGGFSFDLESEIDYAYRFKLVFDSKIDKDKIALFVFNK